jgi:proliferating cell nuclear antigen
MSLANLHKVLKCAGNDDVVTMKADDNGDTVTFMFESPSEFFWGVPERDGGPRARL